MQSNTEECLGATSEEAKSALKSNDTVGPGPMQNVGGLLSTAVTGVGGAVVAGMGHVTYGVGEAVSSVSAGVGGLVSSVGESVGVAVSGASQKVVRCITFPPQSYAANQETSPLECKDKVVDIAITPRIEQPSFSSTIHVQSSKQPFREESESSTQEEEGSDDTSRLEAEGTSICKELGITEELLNGSKDEMLSRLPGLEAKVRDLILDTQPGSGRRRALVHTLIALREHAQSVEELAEMAGLVGGVSVCGHLLVPASKRRGHCDVCTSSLWHLLNTAYECSACKMHVYSSCLRGIRRYCPASYFSCAPPSTSSCLTADSGGGYSTSKTPPPSPSAVSRDSLLTHSSKSDRSSDSAASEASVRSPKYFLPNGPVAHKSPLHVLQDLAIKATDDEDLVVGRWSRKSPLRRKVIACLSVLITRICPERGLSSQGFRCAECGQPITYRVRGEAEGEYGDQPPHAAPSLLLACASSPDKSVAWSEPRLCHYSGLYFCPACHWGDSAVLPALVLHNWDFAPRPVSRCAYQLLQFCYRKPLLDLRALNAHLFTLLQELCEVKKLREDLLLMKQYLCSCRSAAQGRLLHRLASRQHFVDSPHLYSLHDLCDLHAGVLLPQLQAVHDEYGHHIRTTCQVCQGRGHICLNCRAETDVLYPFESRAVQCSDCYAVMHSECYNVQRTCVKCELQGRTGGASIIGAMGETATPVIIKRENDGTQPAHL